MGQRGFTKVYNQNEDFYAAIDLNTCPPFDVLVTNPPYSGAPSPPHRFTHCHTSRTRLDVMTTTPANAYLLPAFHTK